MIPARNRDGMAIFLVVMVTGLAGVFASILIFSGSSSKRAMAIKLEKEQARFLSQGALSHFLLKFKLLPSELYDAVSYSVGKNPYFDFSARMQSVNESTFVQGGTIKSDRGPMFFTGGSATKVSAESGVLSIDRAGEGPNLYLNPAADLGGDPDENRTRMEFLLNHYLLDIATRFPGGENLDNSIVVVSAKPHEEKARMGRADDQQAGPLPKWQDPFDADYSVTQLRLLGVGGANAGRKYQQDSVLVETRATVNRDGQLSPVTRATDGQPLPLPPIQVQKADLKADEGWVDVKYEGKEMAVKSARRTDVATTVLIIQHGKK